MARKPVQKQRKNNAPTTPAKRPGGVTGKGFLPGQSGNPGGRPKGSSITSALRLLMDALRGDLEAGDDAAERAKPVAVARAEALLRGALAGDLAFIREVLDRTDGKPLVRTKNEHAALEGGPGGGVTIYVPDNGRDPDEDRPAAGPPGNLPIHVG